MSMKLQDAIEWGIVFICTCLAVLLIGWVWLNTYFDLRVREQVLEQQHYCERHGCAKDNRIHKIRYFGDFFTIVLHEKKEVARKGFVSQSDCIRFALWVAELLRTIGTGNYSVECKYIEYEKEKVKHEEFMA